MDWIEYCRCFRDRIEFRSECPEAVACPRSKTSASRKAHLLHSTALAHRNDFDRFRIHRRSHCSWICASGSRCVSGRRIHGPRQRIFCAFVARTGAHLSIHAQKESEIRVECAVGANSYRWNWDISYRRGCGLKYGRKHS